MRFAVITDIHGNYPALKAVLKEMDNKEDIDHIYCLGDMIAIGPDTNEVLELLFGRNDISMITGNHEEAVLALIEDANYPKSHEVVKEHHQWIADRMDSTYIDKLKQLPRFISKEIGGISICFTHYAIRSDVPISEDPFETIVDPNLENMELLFKNYEAELVCFGHHHPLHYFKGSQNTYLNPGSLGCTWGEPAAPYAIVTVENKNIDIQLKKATYDNKDFLSSYEVLQVPEREFILNAFHGMKKGHIP